MYMLSFRTVIVTVCERTGEGCDAVYLSHLREGGTQNYKVVKNKKGKSFIFLVVPSLRPMMIRLGTGPSSGRITVPVDHRCLLSLHYGLRIGKESYGEALHERQLASHPTHRFD